MQRAAEQLVQAGFEGPVPRQVQELTMRGVRDPGRGVDQAGAQGRGEMAAGAKVTSKI